MASLYTDTANDQTPVVSADTWTREDGVKRTGDLTFVDATYTLTTGTDETSGDVLYVCKIPAGSIVLPEHCFVVREALGTAFNIATIGYAPVASDSTVTADPDAFSTAINITSAGTSAFAYAAQANGLAAYKATEDLWLTATLGTVTSPTAGKIIRFSVALATPT